MAAVTAIVEFIQARLDEDQQAAERVVQLDADGVLAGWVKVSDDQSDAEKAHLELHPGARVLRAVAAKRLILAVHCPGREVRQGPRPATVSCAGCGFGGPCDDPFTEDVNECPTLRAVASEWSTHPDYRPEWTPSSDCAVSGHTADRCLRGVGDGRLHAGWLPDGTIREGSP